jgi:hypothetical protein
MGRSQPVGILYPQAGLFLGIPSKVLSSPGAECVGSIPTQDPRKEDSPKKIPENEIPIFLFLYGWAF